MICFDGKFRVLQMSRYKSYVKIQDRLFYAQNLGMMISKFKNYIGAYWLPSHNVFFIYNKVQSSLINNQGWVRN